MKHGCNSIVQKQIKLTFWQFSNAEMSCTFPGAESLFLTKILQYALFSNGFGNDRPGTGLQ